MEVVAESIAASTAKVTFNLGKAQIDGFTASVLHFDVADASDPNACAVMSNHSASSDCYSGTAYGGWRANLVFSGGDFYALSTENDSELLISYNPDNNAIYNNGSTKVRVQQTVRFSIVRNATFTPISIGFSGSAPWAGEWTTSPTLAVSDEIVKWPHNDDSFSRAPSPQTISFALKSECSIPMTDFTSVFGLSFMTGKNSMVQYRPYSFRLVSMFLSYTTPELQFAAACSAYRNLGFTYDKNEGGEFTAFRNPRLRFKLNLPSDYSAYIDNENVSVRVKFKNGEAYSEMVLEGSTFMSDGSGGYTCTFSLTNIPPEHFQDEISFIPIIEGMDLVEQTGDYRTPKCCVITLGASVKSMVDAYRGSLYSSLTEAQQEAITAFAEYYASYLA